MNGTKNGVIRLYSPSLITVATLLGAPVAGCILLAHNYRSLGKQSTARQLLIWGILGTALLLVVAFFLPENFPPVVLPVAYTVGMHQAVKQSHGKDYEGHIASGGAKGSTWKAILTGVGCLCAIMVVIFLVVTFLIRQEDPSGSAGESKTHEVIIDGKKYRVLTHGELDKDGVKELLSDPGVRDYLQSDETPKGVPNKGLHQNGDKPPSGEP